MEHMAQYIKPKINIHLNNLHLKKWKTSSNLNIINMDSQSQLFDKLNFYKN